MMLLSDIDSWSNRDTNALPHISTRPMRAEEPRLYLGGEYGARRELNSGGSRSPAPTDYRLAWSW